MKKEALQTKLNKLAFKVLNKYQTRMEMINTLYEIGMTRHECMTLELLLLGKGYESIRKTLLFSEEHYNDVLMQLMDTLKNHDKKVKLFRKLKGTR